MAIFLTRNRVVPDGSSVLDIGLLNNMPDSALKATERQFMALLDAAAPRKTIRLSLYALPEISRSETARRHIADSYSPIHALLVRKLDGLIVTGAEPCSPDLKCEPYSNRLSEVLAWADTNTHSTIWSCLAAHAAVLKMDGIARRKNDEKFCGVMECSRVLNHSLTIGVPARFSTPHSRWNGISEDELLASGYTILSRTLGGQVDTFVKRRKSLFVFFQGHPEYDSDSLLLEFRRDVARFCNGEAQRFPTLPQTYFDENTSAKLMAIREGAASGSREHLLAEVTAALREANLANAWRPVATQIYRNWIEYICAQKGAAECRRPTNSNVRIERTHSIENGMER
ncbi:MAG TPA: homoserine O-succinyltransferase [Candidatus Acidoferrales bacterium]|jgi:homoserine O-succinyltransferase|nr:homoserine O-succinyltransferase [Candidatus Acidoferrales bacterium]